jgi:hypothetical protein
LNGPSRTRRERRKKRCAAPRRAPSSRNSSNGVTPRSAPCSTRRASRQGSLARNQCVALQRFLDDGRLPVHNNISELNLRRHVVGRRNWLFVGSDDGAVTNTRFVSLLASARLHDIEPQGYIRDLFCLLPAGPGIAFSNSLPPTGSRPSSSAKLRRSWPPTSSVASCSTFRADLRRRPIAPRSYAGRLSSSGTGETERIRYADAVRRTDTFTGTDS